ncbi:MAG TPA: efflux RND transporter periplasmic adaptor subunit [Candidatus Paceibacterota bacterium]|nr:efflux RND transporter periplasmic adaptor subunit [Candidatus Paceibacterota bacterium]
MKIWTYIKAHKIITAIVVVVVLVGGYIAYKKIAAANAPTQYIMGAVTTDTLVASVEGTGQVSAKNQLDIVPQGSGQIVSIPAKQGAILKVGQTIAVIDERSANVSLAQAKASLDSAQANYNKVINGATTATVNQSQVGVQTAQTNLQNSIQSAYTQTDNLIRTDLDKFFNAATSYSPQFQVSFYDSSSGSTIVLKPNDQNQILTLNAERVDIGKTLINWRADISATSSFDVDAQAAHTIQYLNQIQKFINDIADAVNSISLSQTKYQSNIDTFKTDVASARSTVTNLISNIQSNQQALSSARASLSVTTAPARAEDVASARASLESAQASYQAALNTYNNNIIKAPFEGTLAVLNIKVGDVVGGSTVVGTLTTSQKLAEITLNEVDVAKIALGEKVTLTFDALPDLTIEGTVAEIDTVGAVTQGVVDYTVKIGFDTQDTRVLPGMSVSASIVTLTKPNVLLVPTAAVKTSPSGKSYVQKIPGITTAGPISTKTKPVNVPVEIGESNNTQTEIVSGLNAGDVIVVRTLTSGSSVTAGSANSASAGNRTFFGGGAAAGGGSRTISR